MRIVASAPARISLIGGGTDIASFADVYGGAVISLAINIRQKVTLYTEDDMWELTTHLFPSDADPQLFYKILDSYGVNGLHHTRIYSRFEGIMGAGLGSSGSAAVALIAAIARWKQLPYTRNDIAKNAWDIEVNLLEWYGGKQDQYASAFGGLNYITMRDNVEVYPFSRECGDKLLRYLVLFYTGKRQGTKKIQDNFKKLTVKQIEHLQKLYELALDTHRCLLKEDILGLGEMLHESWEHKKASNALVATPRINEVYDYAIKSGAIGGKLLGAGGGGYMIFVVEPRRRKSFIQAMAKQRCEPIDFSICWNGVETRIL